MLDRRLFCLASAAVIALPRGASAAAPVQPADAPFARMLDGFYRAALDESPTLATSLGVHTGVRASAKARLDDASRGASASSPRSWRSFAVSTARG